MNSITLTDAFNLFKPFAGSFNIVVDAATAEWNSFDDDLKQFCSYQEILESYQAMYNLLPPAVKEKLQ